MNANDIMVAKKRSYEFMYLSFIIMSFLIGLSVGYLFHRDQVNQRMDEDFRKQLIIIKEFKCPDNKRFNHLGNNIFICE